VPEEISVEELADLHTAGVRSVRVNVVDVKARKSGHCRLIACKNWPVGSHLSAGTWNC
jgi:hypothetical protein